MRSQAIGVMALAILSVPAYADTPTVWTTNFNNVGGASGYIEFNDWGYKGPNGVGANDFMVGTGFDSSRIGQAQNVITTGPDFKTSDPAHTVLEDIYQTQTYTNANMDSAVNFYKWGYTTVAGSTFNNMQIDKAGNYLVARDNMSFQYYNTFEYRDTTNANPAQTVDTNINFQPYAISDAKGWCGSVLISNPNGLEKMAGQVMFDFAFDAYLNNDPNPGMKGNPLSAIQIVPGFVMRSYGSYHVYWNDGTDVLDYYGSAVMNNTDPLTGLLDPASHNQVSFLGAGVVPEGVWININAVRPDGSWDYGVAATQGADGTTDGEVRVDGAVWHFNAFAGYAFLMRADGSRILTYINPAGHSDYVSTVPVPAALWLLGSGLLGLVGVARRKVQ